MDRGEEMLVYLTMIDSPQDKDKFSEIYARYKGLMFHVVQTLVQNPEDAEDIVHQAFLYILDNLDKIEHVNSGETKSYILIVCEHLALDFLRRGKLHQAQPLEILEKTRWESMPTSAEVGDLLLRLKPLYRDVIFLHYIHGYTEKEIAAQMGISYGNIRKILQRARAALQDLLNEE
ncbi:MAG: sigma-70 family RNA polymerase sigma factor [Oscillospiraceae bacterium]|nr:sigma-70 family RNA polymerase sigma factor [Oscillospiraceae bacterium]